MITRLSEFTRRPLVNFLFAISAAMFLIFFDFSLFKLLVEHEVLRYSLLYKPHWVVKDFSIFFFLASMIFAFLNKEIRPIGSFLGFNPMFFTLHMCLGLLFYGLMQFITHRLAIFQAQPVLFSLGWSVVGILMGICAVLCFLRPGTVAQLLMSYKKEWAISFIFSAVFLYLPQTLFDFWKPLSIRVGRDVLYLLGLTYRGAFFDEKTFFLGIKDFAVYVYKPCSGVEGIRLFLFLFTAVIIFDWKRVSKLRLAVVYPIGVVVMFLADVVRIYFIVVLGYELFKRYGYQVAYKIALENFHSNFGWLFYSLVIMVLFKLLYPFMVRGSDVRGK